ncbi:MAG: amidohydrolase family protein [Planctomycetota bacterium]|nr:amidohydrolase family protein [Planctomycetota bacterium]
MRFRVSGAFSLPIWLVLTCASAAAQEQPVAFTGARLLPIDGPAIENGTLVVHQGKIVAIGSATDIELSGRGIEIDASGKTIMPGLVDSHSHIGSVSGGDRSGPIQPAVRALDAINARDAGIPKARAGGITTVNVMPGSGHLLSGQTIYLKLRDGQTIEELTMEIPGLAGVAGGIKMANGTNPQKGSPFPGTRGKAAALMRAQLHRARDYQRKVEAAAGDPDKMPDRSLAMEALVEVLEGKRMVHHHTHRQDDILTVLRMQREFGFRVVLHHVSEGWLVAEEIAAANAPCSVIVIDSPGGKLEAARLSMATGKILDEAGVLVGFHSDDGITDSRLFLRSAALGVRAGMDRQKALEAVTIANAKMLDLQDRVGSLTVVKDADFIVLSGDPLSVYTQVLETWVEGQKLFDLSDPEDRLLAMGGYNASVDQLFSLCCYDTGWLQGAWSGGGK